MRFPRPQAHADPAFKQCLDEVIGTLELLQNFDRLYGATLVTRKSPIEIAIDDATGKRQDDFRAFVKFVHECIYLPLGDDVLECLRAGRRTMRKHPVGQCVVGGNPSAFHASTVLFI